MAVTQIMVANFPKLGERRAGVLLHPTSLPGRWATGGLGPEALSFLDWLTRAGQSYWQMLPLVPPAGGNSPYQSSSAYARHADLISPEWLLDDGLLEQADLDGATPEDRQRLVGLAFERFRHGSELQPTFQAYIEAESGWLDDYALYSALKAEKPEGTWADWAPALRRRDASALSEARETRLAAIRRVQFEQFMFDRQWARLKEAAEARNISLMGDMPIFVGHDSADVWARQHEYYLDDLGKPTVVAGVPPDAFSKTGQRWGNALYRWDQHRQSDYAWWVGRFRQVFRHFHCVRVDHFIGFHRYWEIPASEPTAVVGKYQPGPGYHFFERLSHHLGKVQILAEDLGLVTPEVTALREHFGYPGMKVLQFCLGADEGSRNEHPHTHKTNLVLYTGTHDNNTTAGWYEERAKGPGEAADRAFALRYLDCSAEDIVPAMVRAVYRSQADTAILPLQDVLELGAEARMNTPSVTEGNWSWRCELKDLTNERARYLRELAALYHRLAKWLPNHWVRG